jgi:AmmeMemoRadiSam system protein B
MPSIRKAAVAGGFYPRFKEELYDLISKSFEDPKYGPGAPLKIGIRKKDAPRKVLGGVMPHAGYIYSACCATFTVQQICKENPPDTIIILGNVHTGYRDISVMKEGAWQTPFGNQLIDNDLAQKIVSKCNTVVSDEAAFMGYPHGREHNIEVQIPFIQYASSIAHKEIKFVPIAVGVMEPNAIENFAKQLAIVLKEEPKSKDIAVIASSDMTHHEPRDMMNPAKDIEWQHQKDNAVIQAFLEYNWQKTYQKAQETTVCGPQTISSLLILGKELGYSKTAKLKYYTSYEKMNTEGPCEYSVGYFSGIVCND